MQGQAAPTFELLKTDPLGFVGQMRLEDAAHLATTLGVLTAVFVLWRWRRQTQQRQARTLFALEDKFNHPLITRARGEIEDDLEYERMRAPLAWAVVEPRARQMFSDYELYRTGPHSLNDMRGLDRLLRFYVFLKALLVSRQVSLKAARICFRYWLTLCHHSDRRELRAYVRRYYPTLWAWIVRDASRVQAYRVPDPRFLRPEEFGWRPFGSASLPFSAAIRGRVLVITGSGISVESGIGTFRGPGGRWKGQDPKQRATRTAFDQSPADTWRWYRERRDEARGAQPNKAHHLVARILARAHAHSMLLTQNVDDLHERAESPWPPVHMHGQLFQDRCTKCGRTTPDGQSTAEVPRCTACDGVLRPDVIWFDEDLDPRVEETVNRFIDQQPVDVVLLIGTTGLFVMEWALRAARHGGWLVEINPEETPLSALVDARVPLAASRALEVMEATNVLPSETILTVPVAAAKAFA